MIARHLLARSAKSTLGKPHGASATFLCRKTGPWFRHSDDSPTCAPCRHRCEMRYTSNLLATATSHTPPLSELWRRPSARVRRPPAAPSRATYHRLRWRANSRSARKESVNDKASVRPPRLTSIWILRHLVEAVLFAGRF